MPVLSFSLCRGQDQPIWNPDKFLGDTQKYGVSLVAIFTRKSYQIKKRREDILVLGRVAFIRGYD